MSTFNLIIKKIINLDDSNYFVLNENGNENKNNKINLLIKILFGSFVSNKITINKKFNFFYDTLNNSFFKNNYEEFIYYFCKIQKTYKSFSKLANIYRYKYSKIVVNTDIGLNKIDEKIKFVDVVKNNKWDIKRNRTSKKWEGFRIKEKTISDDESN